MRKLALILTLLAAAGCEQSVPPTAIPKLNAQGTRDLVYQELQPGQSVSPDDQVKILIDVVTVNAPMGYLAGNQTLLSLLSPPTATQTATAAMQANGIRIGIISAAQWPKAKQAMELAPSVNSQTATLIGPEHASLSPRDLQHETIFYFDNDHRLQGRTFDEAHIYWSIFFAPVSTDRTNIQLRLTPVVRAKRLQLKATRVGESYEIEHVIPETLLDTSFTSNLPLGSALVLTPMPQASQSSLGHLFLTQENNGVLTEQVLFLFPRAYRYNAKASAKATLKSQEDSKQEIDNAKAP